MINSKEFSCVVLKEVTHLKTLSRIFDTVFEAETNSAEETPLIQNPSLCAIGAMYENTIVGGLVAYELPLLNGTKEMYLYDIAILPDFQRRGIGTMLIATLKDEAKQRGASTIFVEAEADDTAAVAFYRTLESEEIAVRHFNISIP